MKSDAKRTDDSSQTPKSQACDGSFRCPASDHIEGCYMGEGHPDARR